MHTPRRALATSMISKFGAAAATTSEVNTKALKVHSKTRRSIRAEPSVRIGPAMAAATAGTTTISPANPMETPKAWLRWGSSPTGTTSEKTSANEPKAIDQTANHRSPLLVCWGL